MGWGRRWKFTLGVWVGKVGGIFTELSSPLEIEVMEVLVADTHNEITHCLESETSK